MELPAIGKPVPKILNGPESGSADGPILRELDPVFFEEKRSRENPRESVATLSSTVRNEISRSRLKSKYEASVANSARIERMKKSEQRDSGWFGLSIGQRALAQSCRKTTSAATNTGQASRIPESHPLRFSLVNVFIEIQVRRREQAQRFRRSFG